MATTTNYKLTKPAGSDKYDVSVHNANMDAIDAQMKANADAIMEGSNTYETKANAITGLSASGKIITYTKGDGSTGTITTQDTNTDTKVTQTNTTANANYPILLKNGTGTSEVTSTTLFDDGITVNPSTGIVTATKFKGSLEGNATTAISATSATTAASATKASQDASGNVIVDTYATKSELNGKQPTITGGATSITSTNLTSSRVLVSDSNGKVAVSGVTATELEYLDGVTSAIQPQLDGKADTSVATSSTNGLMSAADKDKLDKIEGGANKIEVDVAISSTSTNPVQNKVVYDELDKKLGKDDTALKAVADANGNAIDNTYETKANAIIDLSVSGKTITYTKGNGNTGSITTQDTNTTYSAGTGLALDGTTINHSNSVPAKTTYVGSATAVPRIQYDAQGHITASTTATIYPPTSPGSDGQVWVSDGSGAGAWKTLITVSSTDIGEGSALETGTLYFVYE